MRGWFAEPSAYTNKEGFLALVEADAWIHRMKPDRRLFLWYNKGDPQPWLMRGLASFYDYYYSALNERLPVLSPADVERLPERLNVAVVASRTGDLSRARQVLEAKGLSIWTQTTVQRGKVTLHLGFAKADLKAVPGVLHLTDFAPEMPATVAATGDRTVRVVSVPKQWSRAATLPLPDPGIGGSFWIHLVVRVTRGTGGFGVLNAAGSAFARRVFVETSTREQDVVIEVHPAEAHMLIVENSTPGEIRAELEILSVELMAKPGTPMWSRLQARVPAPAGQR